jgi:hypothetical protein
VRGPDRLCEESTIFRSFRKTAEVRRGALSGGPHGKARLFGPGTIIALVAALAIVVYSFASPAPAAPRMAPAPEPVRPLHKPEPDDLLVSDGLRLTPGQRRRIELISDGWRRSKLRLETAMAGFRPHQGSLDQIRRDLEGYSELSRLYDASRDEAWTLALAVLSETQRRSMR